MTTAFGFIAGGRDGQGLGRIPTEKYKFKFSNFKEARVAAPTGRVPLPLTVPPVVHCNYCQQQIQATVLEPGGHRFLVDHGGMTQFEMELRYNAMEVCPNNGKRWIIEFQQPLIYEMDPVTGEIDTFGGRIG